MGEIEGEWGMGEIEIEKEERWEGVIGQKRIKMGYRGSEEGNERWPAEKETRNNTASVANIHC